MAYAAVTMNLFGDALYQKRGGKGKIKDSHEIFPQCNAHIHKKKQLFMLVLNMYLTFDGTTTNAGVGSS